MPKVLTSLEERFWAKVGPRNRAGCRLWTAGVHKKSGYGQFNFNGRTKRAHRVAFFFTYGYWPSTCRHSCDTPLCCEPTHLHDGTQLDNMRDRDERGRNGFASRTHCPAGHEYTPENTSVWRGKRKCRTCKRARDRARKSHQKTS